jgi:hypothetical protein
MDKREERKKFPFVDGARSWTENDTDFTPFFGYENTDAWLDLPITCQHAPAS